jgi:hypothetical protein
MSIPQNISSGSLAVIMKQYAKYRFLVASMLLLYILQKHINESLLITASQF